MGTADELLDLMFSWMEKREHCAEQLRKLAWELEDLRDKCNLSECVGNTASVVGAASLLGAGVATFFTGGLALPFLGVLGAVSSGLGLTVSLVTQLTEYLLSSETMKKVQSLESESNEIAERMKSLFEQLKVECKAESVNADELDQLFTAEIPAANQRVRAEIPAANQRVTAEISAANQRVRAEIPAANQLFTAEISAANQQVRAMPAIVAGVFTSILVNFAFIGSRKKSKLLFAKAGKQVIEKCSTTGFKTALKGAGTALKGCGKVAGGAVGLAFALPEAIDSWKEMIKKNHVTEASQSLIDTADALDEMILKLLIELEVMIEKMVLRQGEYEEMEEESMEEERKKNPFVRAALLNVHSMNNKTSKILELITANQLDVFFSTETWLESDTADRVLKEASPKNFSFFRHVSEFIRRRGVAIQFSTLVLHGRQIQSDNMKTFECVVTVLQPKEWEEPVLSINLYRPPKKTLEIIHKFLKEFQKLLDQVSQNYNNIIVTGDFNIWVDCDEKTYVKEFYWFLLKNGFNLCPWEPTYYRSGHTLDLLLIRNVEVSDVKVRDDQISDHYTVYFNLRPGRGWEIILKWLKIQHFLKVLSNTGLV